MSARANRLAHRRVSLFARRCTTSARASTERARRSRLLPLGFPKRAAPASSSERPNAAGLPSRCEPGPAATCVVAAPLAGGGHRPPVRALLRALCAAKAAAPLPGVRWAGRLAAALVAVAPPTAAVRL